MLEKWSQLLYNGQCERSLITQEAVNQSIERRIKWMNLYADNQLYVDFEPMLEEDDCRQNSSEQEEITYEHQMISIGNGIELW